jgi:hypothetical protein
MSLVPRFLVKLAAVSAAVLFFPQVASAGGVTDYQFASPLFGLHAAIGGGLLVADAGAGVVKLKGPHGTLVAQLPGVTDAASINRKAVYAVTGAGGPTGKRLYRLKDGSVRQVANLGKFEKQVNPDGGAIDSNPFGVAPLSGGWTLVADAAGNDLLMVSPHGKVDWVATLPEQVVPTKNAKRLAGCPYPPPDLADVCNLPPRIPAQPVATSVAVGPDGAWYVGELKGFPAPLHESRVWRIEPGTMHAQCGSSPACSVVADGLTSIVDIGFDPSGMLDVVQIDDASWLAVELGQATAGTIDACDVSTGDCDVVVHLPIPTAVASTSKHTFATTQSLVPGEATVVRIA